MVRRFKFFCSILVIVLFIIGRRRCRKGRREDQEGRSEGKLCFYSQLRIQVQNYLFNKQHVIGWEGDSLPSFVYHRMNKDFMGILSKSIEWGFHPKFFFNIFIVLSYCI